MFWIYLIIGIILATHKATVTNEGRFTLPTSFWTDVILWPKFVLRKLPAVAVVVFAATNSWLAFVKRTFR